MKKYTAHTDEGSFVITLPMDPCVGFIITIQERKFVVIKIHLFANTPDIELTMERQR